MAANFKTFVEILPEKADNWRNYCICIACRDVNGRPNALLQKFPFKTERVRNHLKKCQHFKNKYPEIFFELFASETERMEINEFDENIVSSKRLRRESTGSVHSAITSISLRSIYLLFYLLIIILDNFILKLLLIFFYIGSNNSSIGTLDSFITRPLATRSFTKGEQAIFEKLMIQATVSAGFPLRWVENKEVQELFHFLNPALILPGRKTLGGRILNDESKILENEMTKKLMNDSVGVTLAFDGWTNVLNQNILGSVFITSEGEVIIWKAVDVSSELERWKEVIEKTETMFKEINKMGVNLISVVTDSAPSYAAARYICIFF